MRTRSACVLTLALENEKNFHESSGGGPQKKNANDEDDETTHTEMGWGGISGSTYS